MINFRITLVFILLCMCTQHIHAQDFLWNVGMESVFDNREYDSDFNKSQTIFGAILSPEVGVSWNNKHALVLGAFATYEFGSPAKDLHIDPSFYYNYKYKRFNISAGIVPVSQIIGTESRAFINDSVRFFKKTIGGVLLQYINGKNYAEFYCDWDGRQSDARREKFTVYSSGRLTKGILFGTYEFSMHHHAGTMAAEGVTDNLWISPAVGVDLSHMLWLDSLTVSAGYLQSFQNDRSGVGHYVMPKGGELNIRVEKYNVGIYNTLYVGDNMMPYYGNYGSSLYWGDSFYSTTNKIYNRAEIYWTPLRKKNFNLKLASIHHYDGRTWSWQQFIKFSVRIDQDVFKKKVN